ncbi:hypothetical protein ACFJIW_16245 [Tahibacter sp. UC22_41]|uniref:hypothetical protein n=1 Tax=Tahibacter sp. UC22_41 TaxID=3350178 RepID=UPI0036DA8D4B
MEEALHEIASMRQFSGRSPTKPTTDETKTLNFRRLLKPCGRGVEILAALMLPGMTLHPVIGERIAALLDGVATANSIKSHPRLLPLLTGWRCSSRASRPKGAFSRCTRSINTSTRRRGHPTTLAAPPLEACA